MDSAEISVILWSIAGSLLVGGVSGYIAGRNAVTTERVKARLQDLSRRQQRSEETARECISIVEELFQMFLLERERGSVIDDGPSQKDLEPGFRRLSLLLPNLLDPAAREKMERVAVCFYNYDGATYQHARLPGRVAWVARDAGLEVLGAVIRGEDVPSTEELDAVHADIEAFFDAIFRED